MTNPLTVTKLSSLINALQAGQKLENSAKADKAAVATNAGAVVTALIAALAAFGVNLPFAASLAGPIGTAVSLAAVVGMGAYNMIAHASTSTDVGILPAKKKVIHAVDEIKKEVTTKSSDTSPSKGSNFDV
jgi:hypothetical protein